jgi:hypothetical protein
MTAEVTSLRISPQSRWTAFARSSRAADFELVQGPKGQLAQNIRYAPAERVDSGHLVEAEVPG